LSHQKQKPKAKISNLHVFSNQLNLAAIFAGAGFAKSGPIPDLQEPKSGASLLSSDYTELCLC